MNLRQIVKTLKYHLPFMIFGALYGIAAVDFFLFNEVLNNFELINLIISTLVLAVRHFEDFIIENRIIMNVHTLSKEEFLQMKEEAENES